MWYTTGDTITSNTLLMKGDNPPYYDPASQILVIYSVLRVFLYKVLQLQKQGCVSHLLLSLLQRILSTEQDHL